MGKNIVETAICGPYVIQRLQDATITITRCNEVPRKLTPVLREFAKIFDVRACSTAKATRVIPGN